MPAKKPKISPTEYAQMTAQVMLDFPHGEGWTNFPAKIVAIKSDTSDPLYYQVSEDRVFSRISEDALCSQILSYWALCSATSRACLTPKAARMAIEFFLAYSKPYTKTILPVRFKSEGGDTYYRLPFDPVPGQTPTFDEMFARMINANAVKAWIGSLFDNASERQQYVWIYGEGGNGKSRLGDFLHWVLGEAAGACLSYNYKSPFWTSQFLDKRLMLFPDCDDPVFINSGIWKSLTGGDRIRIEIKNGGIYSAALTCKFLAFSNKRPQIENEASAMRRVIFAEMAAFAGEKIPEKDYSALLISEAPAFIHQCLEAYRYAAPNGGFIRSDEGTMDRIISDSEERWLAATKKYLHVWPVGYFDGVPRHKAPKVRPEEFFNIMKLEGWKMWEYTNFKNYLERRHGVRKMSVRLENQEVCDVYVNCTLSNDYTNYANMTIVKGE